MSQSLCNSLFLHFYIFLQCEDVLNIVSYIVPPLRGESLARKVKIALFKISADGYQSPYGAKALQVIVCSIIRVISTGEYQSPYGAKALQGGIIMATTHYLLFEYQSPYGAKALQE